MIDFELSLERRQAELAKVRERGLTKSRLFVLLLGPSATGKSTIIQALGNQSPEEIAFEYVKPVMTRPNRPEEVDKISVPAADFAVMEARGEFVVVNDLYGVRYGTPLRGVLDPLQAGRVPILDYPLQNLSAIQRPEYDTLTLYVYPPSVEAWRQRIEASGRDRHGRVEAGLVELGQLALQDFVHPDIDVSVVNQDGAAQAAADDIIQIVNQVIG